MDKSKFSYHALLTSGYLINLFLNLHANAGVAQW